MKLGEFPSLSLDSSLLSAYFQKRHDGLDLQQLKQQIVQADRAEAQEQQQPEDSDRNIAVVNDESQLSSMAVAVLAKSIDNANDILLAQDKRTVASAAIQNSGTNEKRVNGEPNSRLCIIRAPHYFVGVVDE